MKKYVEFEPYFDSSKKINDFLKIKKNESCNGFSCTENCPFRNKDNKYFCLPIVIKRKMLEEEGYDRDRDYTSFSHFLKSIEYYEYFYIKKHVKQVELDV